MFKPCAIAELGLDVADGANDTSTDCGCAGRTTPRHRQRGKAVVCMHASIFNPELTWLGQGCVYDFESSMVCIFWMCRSGGARSKKRINSCERYFTEPSKRTPHHDPANARLDNVFFSHILTGPLCHWSSDVRGSLKFEMKPLPNSLNNCKFHHVCFQDHIRDVSLLPRHKNPQIENLFFDQISEDMVPY